MASCAGAISIPDLEAWKGMGNASMLVAVSSIPKRVSISRLIKPFLLRVKRRLSTGLAWIIPTAAGGPLIPSTGVIWNILAFPCHPTEVDNSLHILVFLPI
jgi:hypothetical protein